MLLVIGRVLSPDIRTMAVTSAFVLDTLVYIYDVKMKMNLDFLRRCYFLHEILNERTNPKI